jgi:hypothetical protein
MRPAVRGQEEVNVVQLIANYWRSLHVWWQIGDSPPRTHYVTIGSAIVFAPLGLYLMLRCFSSKPLFVAGPEMQPICFALQFVLGLLLVIPSGHVIFLAICCWRRVSGYDWWMIPHIGSHVM